MLNNGEKTFKNVKKNKKKRQKEIEIRQKGRKHGKQSKYLKPVKNWQKYRKIV